MSKCSVLSTCQSNLWYSTLLRPKYWAEAPPARQASRAAAAASRIAVRGKKDERDIEPPFDRSTFLKPRIVFKSGARAPPCAKPPAPPCWPHPPNTPTSAANAGPSASRKAPPPCSPRGRASASPRPSAAPTPWRPSAATCSASNPGTPTPWARSRRGDRHARGRQPGRADLGRHAHLLRPGDPDQRRRPGADLQLRDPGRRAPGGDQDDPHRPRLRHGPHPGPGRPAADREPPRGGDRRRGGRLRSAVEPDHDERGGAAGARVVLVVCQRNFDGQLSLGPPASRRQLT